MKEATGELNMTVITVVAIAAVAAFFYAFVWPSIQTSLAGTTACNAGAGAKIGTSADADYVDCSDANADGEYSCSFNVKKGNNNLVTRTKKCNTK